MRQVTEQSIKSLVKNIVDEFHPEFIYLFGSRARGEMREDSDVDLLIIVSEPFDKTHSRRMELSRLWRLVACFRLPVDVLLFSRNEVEEWRTSGSHVIGRALREGRPLYAAA